MIGLVVGGFDLAGRHVVLLWPSGTLRRSFAQKDQENTTFRYHRGVALLQNGEKNKARTEFRAALTKKPQQADEKKIRELLAGIS